MKKICLAIIVIILILSGCQAIFSHYHPEPPEQIILRSVDELEELELALESDNADKIANCLSTLGISSEKEAQKFLDTLKTLPVANLMNGTITLIMSERSSIIERDAKGNLYDTGRISEWFHITTTATDGSWVRVSYWISDNVNEEEIRKNLNISNNTLSSKPFVTEDKRITVFSEVRQTHPTGNGKVITWVSKIDEMYAEINYFSENTDGISTENMFSNARISTGKLG